MSDQLMSLGVIGIRLYARILTAPATHPDELADHIIDEINCYLMRASAKEKALLFYLACETHETLSRALRTAGTMRDRKEAILQLNLLIAHARALTHKVGC